MTGNGNIKQRNRNTLFDFLLDNDLWLRMENTAPVAQQVTLFDSATAFRTKVQTVYSYSIPSSVFPTLGVSVSIVKNGSPVTVTLLPQTAATLTTLLTTVTGVEFVRYPDTVNGNQLFYTAGAGSTTFGAMTIGATPYAVSTNQAAGGTGISIELQSQITYNQFVGSLSSMQGFFFYQMGVYANTPAQLAKQVTMTKFQDVFFGAKYTESFTPPMNKFQPQYVYDPVAIHFDVDGNNTFTYTVAPGESVLWRLATKAYDIEKMIGNKDYVPSISPEVINGIQFLNDKSQDNFMAPVYQVSLEQSVKQLRTKDTLPQIVI